MTINGEVWIDHEDFGLPMIRLMVLMMVLMMVDPKLKIRFHVMGRIK